MAKLTESQLVLKDKSGNGYTFSIYPFGEECKDESGIYAFSKRTKNDAGNFDHTVLYIGMAKSFEKRLYDHHKEECATKKGANCLCLMQVKNQQNRETIEKALIEFNKPACNEVYA